MPSSTVTHALVAIDGGSTPRDIEDGGLEFKEQGRSIKATLALLAETTVCLANADGGSIVVGIADVLREGTAYPGVSPSLTTSVIRRGIFDRTSPSLSVLIHEFEHAGANLIEIEVPIGATIYATTNGTVTRRVGAECRPFPPEQQRELLVARGHLDWSAQLVHVPVGDAQPSESERMRRLLAAAGHDDLVRLDDTRMLVELRLARDTVLTRAGLLLVGSPQQLAEHIPGWAYQYQYRPTIGQEATARLSGRKPLLTAVEALLDAVEARRTVRPLNTAGGVQLQLHDYSTSAVRELIVNALVHRSFENAGDVEVLHSAESLIITSPGGLVHGVTPDNILSHPSTPRHRLLFETVVMLQIAERTGQGIDRAYREQLRVGKRPPIFEDTQNSTRVVIDGGTGDERFVRFVVGLPESASRDVDVLLALTYLRQKRLLDATVLAKLTQRSAREAQAVLSRMMDPLGLVEATKRTASRAWPNYRLRSETIAGLGRAVKYNVAAPDAQDEKVVEHLREYGFVTNATLRRMFDIDVYAARNLLASLQRRDIITKIGDRELGPGVRYGPGVRMAP